MNEENTQEEVTTSPVPPVPTPMPNHAPADDFPICKCGERLDEVRSLDYGETRVVFHTGKGCIVGVMKAE